MSTTTVPNKPSTPKSPQNTQKDSQQSQPKQQQQSTMFNADAIKKNWKQLTGFAKTKWSKLSEEELTKSGGDEQKLTGLVKDRYNIPRDDANQQVKGFFAKNAHI